MTVVEPKQSLLGAGHNTDEDALPDLEGSTTQVDSSPVATELEHDEFSECACRGGIDLEWRSLDAFVSEPLPQGRLSEWLGFEQSPGPPTKQILCGSSGFARSGELLAVMGPSGSGKTTLLNILAQRPTLGVKGYWQGSLLLNGAPPWPDWEREMAYVMQKDIFYDELRVLENLQSTALLRLPLQWSAERKLKYLRKLIAQFGLDNVKDTKIGSAVDRGLSGGEVKRTSIVNELMALPRVFLLDEPLTGLDSTRAVEVMRTLQRMARQQGTTVMLTVHQPSSALYECFDRLLLLGTGGRTAFFGDVDNAVPHFSTMGHPLPPLWAPADHFIDILSDRTSCAQVCEAWHVAAGQLQQPPPPRPFPMHSASSMPPFWYQFNVLFPRSFKRIRRSYLKGLALKLHVALALVFGVIFWGVGADIDNRLPDMVGAIFFLVAHWSWTPLFQGLGNFPKEKEMLTKERSAKLYDTSAFFVSQVLAEAGLLLVFPVVFFLILWPMCAMPLQAVVPTFCLIAVNIQVCSALSMWISVVCMDEDLAITTAIIVMVAEMVAGGFYADMRLLPWWIGWVRFLSLYYYSFGSVLHLLVTVPYGEERYEKAIKDYSFSDSGVSADVTVLLLMCVAFRVAAFVQLSFTKKLSFS